MDIRTAPYLLFSSQLLNIKTAVEQPMLKLGKSIFNNVVTCLLVTSKLKVSYHLY
jgi:hypothetical protein